MSANSTKDSQFIFKRHDVIGSAGAEDDTNFLSECFVDTGDIGVLEDPANPKCIIVGRTGSGKTALLTMLENTEQKIINLSPHSLALNYIANNNVIRFFEETGVNLLPFYGLLWRHIFVVELLKSIYGICSQETQKQGLARLRELVSKDNIKEQAVDYLENWGTKFWLTTEQRMQQLTTKVEKSLEGSLKTGGLGVNIVGKGAENLTEEQRQEVIERGRQAVSEVQIRELDNLIGILNEILSSNRQLNYYILIDSLDEEWAEDKLRFKLIKALIDTLKRFRRVEPLKIVVALRKDLLEKVLHSSQDPGFQEEKYESLYLNLSWNEDQLEELITRRINALVKRRYTGEAITPIELFPEKIDGKGPIKYILSRTFMRPRDAILFLNECIGLAEGKPNFTATIVKKAEESYSVGRLTNLAHEWNLIYPNLRHSILLLRGMNEHFPVSTITQSILTEAYEEIVDLIANPSADPITQRLEKLYAEEGNFGSVRAYILRIFYELGVVGVKIGGTSSVRWSQSSNVLIPSSQIRANSTIFVHPMFHRALDIHYL